jgi:hypothetical protein
MSRSIKMADILGILVTKNGNFEKKSQKSPLYQRFLGLSGSTRHAIKKGSKLNFCCALLRPGLTRAKVPDLPFTGQTLTHLSQSSTTAKCSMLH